MPEQMILGACCFLSTAHLTPEDLPKILKTTQLLTEGSYKDPQTLGIVVKVPTLQEWGTLLRHNLENVEGISPMFVDNLEWLSEQKIDLAYFAHGYPVDHRLMSEIW